jgi:2-amino-4-hydroxy-6-hydroxymethyldihydropteridine diphosphokinase
MSDVYFSIGSNLGDRKISLEKAVFYIEKIIGKIIKTSSVFESEPWGVDYKEKYLNQVLLCQTILSPVSVLNEILKIEKLIGRKKREVKYESRIIDIDILFYDNQCINTKSLVVPHPLLHKRKFVLAPLNEINNKFIHPIFNKSIKQLLNKCSDNLKLEKINNTEKKQ